MIFAGGAWLIWRWVQVHLALSELWMILILVFWQVSVRDCESASSPCTLYMSAGCDICSTVQLPLFIWKSLNLNLFPNCLFVCVYGPNYGYFVFTEFCSLPVMELSLVCKCLVINLHECFSLEDLTGWYVFNLQWFSVLQCKYQPRAFPIASWL